MLKKNKHLLFSLVLLTFFFILIQISFLIQRSEFFLGDFKLVAEHLSIPASVLPGICYFLFSQCLMYFLFIVFVFMLVYFAKLEKFGITVWFLTTTVVLLANVYFFPNSKFSKLILDFIPETFSQGLLWLFAGLLLIVIFLAMVNACRAGFAKLKIILFCLCPAFIFFSWPHSNKITDSSTPERPNIIIIGIDSMRPDYLSYYGNKTSTPHLDHFLKSAIVFSQALTPLARTYPAWVSILSGQYPKVNGIRFNLSQFEPDYQVMLPSVLSQQGYETIFATDETRFSNLDERFGFHQVITPPIGFNDFLLGTFNDFPLANLLSLTPLGKLFFPYSYANRAVFDLYDPNYFIHELSTALNKPRSSPLFLAVHFCLPHFPYFWGTHSANSSSLENYVNSVNRIDHQFNDFLKILTAQKLLTHAIVIVLSDHGEAFELPGDRVTEENRYIPGKQNKNHSLPKFYPPSADFEKINQSAGHGTDVLGITQYHVLMAMKVYGMKNRLHKEVPQRVSLLDIKPTLLDFLKLSSQNGNGHSLKKIIEGDEKIFPVQDFFTESDFSPSAIHSVHPETKKLLFQGIDFFRIDPVNGRIVVKKSMADLILSSKQYADFYGEWVLAWYPQTNHSRVPILVNLSTGAWTDDLTTDFAKHSPAKRMTKSMKDFFSDKLYTVSNFRHTHQ